MTHHVARGTSQIKISSGYKLCQWGSWFLVVLVTGLNDRSPTLVLSGLFLQIKILVIIRFCLRTRSLCWPRKLAAAVTGVGFVVAGSVVAAAAAASAALYGLVSSCEIDRVSELSFGGDVGAARGTAVSGGRLWYVGPVWSPG
eukprot:sb/3474129/